MGPGSAWISIPPAALITSVAGGGISARSAPAGRTRRSMANATRLYARRAAGPGTVRTRISGRMDVPPERDAGQPFWDSTRTRAGRRSCTAHLETCLGSLSASGRPPRFGRELAAIYGHDPALSIDYSPDAAPEPAPGAGRFWSAQRRRVLTTTGCRC